MKPLSSALRVSPSTWFVLGWVIFFFVASYGAREWLRQRQNLMAQPNDRMDLMLATGDGMVIHGGDEKTGELNRQMDQQMLSPQRIVGLAPSTVEALFALNLGDKVVGISRYSTYPPAAMNLPKIAGFMDIDFEKLIALEPDCVVMVESQQSLVEKLHQLGVPTVMVKHASVEGIIDSFTLIGEACAQQDEAEFQVNLIKRQLEKVRQKSLGKKKPRVLVCIERDPDSPRPDRVVAAGSGGFHRQLIELAGGVNAYQGSIAYPVLSREKLMKINPDVIIDLIRDETYAKYGEQKLLWQWASFAELSAVKNKRVVIVAGNQHLIPGPRFLQTLDAMAEGIHPASGK